MENVKNSMSMNHHWVAMVLTTMFEMGRMVAVELGAARLMRSDETIRLSHR